MTTRTVEVEVVGDAAQLEATLGRASRSLAKFGGDADALVAAQLRGGVKQRSDLEATAAAWQRAADAAVKGSEEERIALQKLGETQTQIARLAQESAAKQVAAANESAAAFSRTTSGLFGFAKQAAFFGAGYLGFEGLKNSIDTVLAAETSISQLDRAITNAHASVSKLTPVLEKYDATSRKLGFDNNETRQAEAELVTAFGATKKALGELSLAQDLARAKNETLATATQNLILIQEGNTRAAKQFGLVIPDQSKAVWEAKAAQDGLTISQEKGKTLYDELLPRIKDQAAAFADTPTGKMQEFHAEIQAVEESIGQGLLPVVDKYLTEVDAWLSKSDNQKRVTRDVETAVHDLGTALHDAYVAVEAVLSVVDPVVRALGGWQTAIEALIALKFASVITGWGASVSGGLMPSLGKLIGEGGFGGAVTSSSKLMKNLGGLAAVGSIAVGVDLLIKSSGDAGAKGFLESLFGAGLVGFTFGGPEGALAVAGIDLIVYASTHSGGDKNTPTKPGASYGPGRGRVTGQGRPVYDFGHPEHPYKQGGVTVPKSAIDISYDTRTKRYTMAITQPNGSIASETISAKEAAKLLGLTTKELQKEIFTDQTPVGPSGPRGPAGPLNLRQEIVFKGKEFKGTGGGTYQPGGGHTSGQVKIGSALDCSGFVYQSLLAAGVKGFSYGNAASQFAALQRGGGGNWASADVGVSGARPGDLVYWDNLTGETQPAHCGIVVSGSGAGAKVMQYEDPKDGSGIGGINEYPVMGVFRLKIIKGRPGAGSSSPYGPARAGAGSQSNNAALAAAAASASASVAASAAAWAKAELTKIETRADSAFERATQAHINNVLAPRYFQGTDKHGNRRMTPAEAQLAAMQQQDTTNQLQQALTQAQASGDATAIAAAQRAITENNLATQATKERAQADADYAKAVRKYQAERARREKELNANLLKFVDSVAKGSAALSGLTKVLEHYGIGPHAGSGGKVHVHVPGHHHAGSGHHHDVPPPPQRPIQITVDVDGRKFASAIAPRSDQVVRVKLS